jgi:hypothetical protein
MSLARSAFRLRPRFFFSATVGSVKTSKSNPSLRNNSIAQSLLSGIFCGELSGLTASFV